MEIRSVLFKILPVILILVAFPVFQTSAQSSPLFEGIIAYIDTTGNVILINGDGGRRQVTSDAYLDYTSNGNITYDELSFSPGGSYLTFFQNGSGRFIYDIANETFISKGLDEGDLSWRDWYTDNSFMMESITIDDEDNADWNIYLQTMSGENTILAKFTTHANVYNLNFRNDTVIYIDPPHSDNINIYNWTKGTVIPSTLHKYSVMGARSPDGRSFILIDDDSSNYYVIDLESGNHREINKNEELEWAALFEISPNSEELLLGNYLHLYGLNIETSQIRTIYSTLYPSEDFLTDIYGIWSPNSRLVAAYENDPAIDISHNFTDLTITDGVNSVLVTKNAEPFRWLSNSSDRFLFAQNIINGNKMTRELMLFDYAKQVSVKLGDLPAIMDTEEMWNSPTESIVDWTSSAVDLPYYSTTGLEPVTNTESKWISLSSSGYFGYFLAAGLGLLCIAVLTVGMVVFFIRSRKSKNDSSKSVSPLSRASSSSNAIRYAISLAESGQLQESFKQLHQIVQSEPENAHAWFTLGTVCTRMQNYKDAERCYLRAKKLGHSKADDVLQSLLKPDNT